MKHFIVVLLLFTAWGATGQRVISGRTVDTDGKAVGYVNVFIRSTRVGTASDGRGRFTLTIPERLLRDTLLLSHVAYEELAIPISELGDKETFTLTPSSLVTDDVVVETRRSRRVTLDQRGEREMECAWTFSRDIAEFGSFFEVEDQFLVHNFRFRLLKPSLTRIKAEMVVYRIENGPMTPVLEKPIVVWFSKPNPTFITSEDCSGRETTEIVEIDYTIRPNRLPLMEDGFIRLDNNGIVRSVINTERTIPAPKRLVLEKGKYLVSLRFIPSYENIILLDRYPWALPWIGAFNKPGLRRRGNQYDFEESDRNAGIIVRGYGK